MHLEALDTTHNSFCQDLWSKCEFPSACVKGAVRFRSLIVHPLDPLELSLPLPPSVSRLDMIER